MTTSSRFFDLSFLEEDSLEYHGKPNGRIDQFFPMKGNFTVSQGSARIYQMKNKMKTSEILGKDAAVATLEQFYGESKKKK